MNPAGDDATQHLSLSLHVLTKLQIPKSLIELEDAIDISGAQLFDCLERLIDEGMVTVEHAKGHRGIFRATQAGRESVLAAQARERDKIFASREMPYSPPNARAKLNPPRFVRAYRGRLLIPMEYADGSGWVCHINLCSGNMREVIDTVTGETRPDAIRHAMSRVDQQICPTATAAYV